MDHTLFQLHVSEIPTVLRKASPFGGKVAQPKPEANAISLIKNIEVDNAGTMFIRIKQDQHIEAQRPLSIKLNYRNITFMLDSKQYTLEGDTLISKVPTDARAIAMRNNDRYVLPLDSKVESLLYRIERRAALVDLQARIVDISSQGLGVIIENPEEDILRANDHIWLKSLNNIPLPEPIFARVVYVLYRQYRDTVDLKAGLSLATPIPSEVMAQVQQHCRLVLKA